MFWRTSSPAAWLCVVQRCSVPHCWWPLYTTLYTSVQVYSVHLYTVHHLQNTWPLFFFHNDVPFFAISDIKLLYFDKIARETEQKLWMKIAALVCFSQRQEVSRRMYLTDVVYYGPNVDAVRENFRHCRLWYAASSSQCFPWHFLWSVFSLVSSIDSAIHACRTRRTLDQKPTVPIREAETGIQQPFRSWDRIDGGHAHKSTVYNGPE